MGILPKVKLEKNESGCEAGDKYLFPHYKVEEQPSKKPKKRALTLKTEKATTKVLWLGCTTIELCLARLRAIRTSKK